MPEKYAVLDRLKLFSLEQKMAIIENILTQASIDNQSFTDNNAQSFNPDLLSPQAGEITVL